uniref:C2H2-type domain-containing protein n=1 Tax=Heterorhabditis bacteriophora TaxID=37862 RepID=A0A1I7XTL0_HETBA
MTNPNFIYAAKPGFVNIRLGAVVLKCIDSVPPVYTQVEIVSTSSINGLDEDSCRTSRKRKFDDGMTMTESGFNTTRQQYEVSCSYCDRKLKSESSLRRHVTYVHDLVEEICKVEGCPQLV